MILCLSRGVKAKHGETIPNYADRILCLAKDAYGKQGGNATERNLIDIVVDGLQNDHLNLKNLRDQLITLQTTIAVTMKEQSLGTGVR